MTITKNTNWKAPRIGAAQIKLLEELSNCVAVSGEEDAVREIVLEKVKPLADDFKTDALGNLLVIKRGKGSNLPRVMLAAHMDEIGFMLIGDDSKGIFRIKEVGGVDPRYFGGKPVWIGKDKLPGVIGLKAIHLTTAEEEKSALKIDSLRVDIGPSNASKAKIGDRGTFATKFARIGPSLLGKAMDNRLGVASLITILENAPQNIDLLAAFTVQE